jgi:hypothetical protein
MVPTNLNSQIFGHTQGLEKKSVLKRSVVEKESKSYEPSGPV